VETLQHAIETASARLGYASEERSFSPHLTIGRVSQRANGGDIQKIRAGLENVTVGELGGARVDAVHLYKSDLQPTGAIYTCLFSAPLGGEFTSTR
jgi:2'-5' RNA ligase